MNKYYFLEEDGMYYVNEGEASFRFENALKIKDINTLVTTIPIMKDWNWDYSVFLYDNGQISKVREDEWISVYNKWKKEDPEKRDALYDTDPKFLRTTRV